MDNLPVEAQDTSAETTSPLAGLPRGRTRQAVDLMVFKGVPRDLAAAQCGMKAKSLCDAFRLPSVKTYYMAQLEVLRSSERARNIHRLVEIRDAANNMPAVQAIKALEEIDDVVKAGPMNRAPGLQIVVVQAPAASPALPNATPVIEHEPTKR